MYVEQRIYTGAPGKLAAWLKVYEALGGPVSARHTGPLLGFFTTEVGPLNKAVFLRGYDDIDDREKGLKAREADPDWAEFRKQAGAIGALVAQENKLMKAVPFSPIKSAKDFAFKRTLPGTTMIVDHRTYDFEPGKLNAWLELYRKQGLPVQERLLGQLLGFFVTEVGQINQAVFMWAYEGLGDREKRRTAMANDPAWGDYARTSSELGALKRQTNMILKPAPFSPIR